MSLKAETPLGKLLRAVGLTTTDVSSVIGLNTGNISRLENGINRPSPETAEKLSAFFRGALTEIHLIYPERFPDWVPAEKVVEGLRDLKSSIPNPATASAL